MKQRLNVKKSLEYDMITVKILQELPQKGRKLLALLVQNENEDNCNYINIEIWKTQKNIKSCITISCQNFLKRYLLIDTTVD